MPLTKYKLGKHPFKYKPKTLQLSKYLKAEAPLPPPPDSVHYPLPNPIGMLCNDILGDCAIAGPCHQEMAWRFANGFSFFPTEGDAITAYENVGGYNPAAPLDADGNNPTDGGCNLLDVLTYWRKNGIAGRVVGAFVQVDFKNIEMLKQAIFLFGGVIVGWELPANLDENAKVWSPGPEGLSGSGTPGSEGGHCTYLNGYNAEGVNNVTWGEEIFAVYDYITDYMDECWAIVSPDWISNNSKAPSGFDIATLMADLKIVTA